MDGHNAAATLLVSRHANQDELRRAFRARAKELHPDTGRNGSAAAFAELRAAFDHLMATAPTARASTPPANPGPAATPTTAASPRSRSRFDVAVTARPGRRLDLFDRPKARTRRANDHPRSALDRVASRPGTRAATPAEDRDRHARAEQFSRHLAAATLAATAN